MLGTIILPIIIIGIIYTLVRVSQPTPKKKPIKNYQLLLRKVMNDKNQAERLIALEAELHPYEDRDKLCWFALQRIKRDQH